MNRRHYDRRRAFSALLGLAGASALALGSSAGLHAQGTNPSPATYSDGLRRWTPEDSIRVRYLYDARNETRQANGWGPGTESPRASEVVSISPDGRHFFVGSHVGELGCNCNRYTLSIFSAAQVSEAMSRGRHDIVPVQRVDGAAIFANAPAPIRGAVWEDSSTLRYIAEDEQGVGVYRLNVVSGDRRTLIRAPVGSARLTYSLHGDTVLAMTFGPRRFDPVGPATSSEWPLGRNPYGWLDLAREAYPITFYAAVAEGPTHQVLTLGSPESPSSTEVLGYLPFPTPQISPDGRWAVYAVPVFSEFSDQPGFMPRVPAGWNRYEELDPTLRTLAPDDYRRLWRYTLVSLTGAAEPRVLIDAPQGPVATSMEMGASPVLWSANGSRIIIANASLPLSEDAAARRSTGYLIDYDVASGRANVIEPMRRASTDGQGGRIRSLSWQGEELVVRYAAAQGRPPASRIYGRGTSGWQGREGPREETAAAIAVSPAPPLAPAAPPALARGLTLELREGPNDPPELIARLGGRELSLLGPDPALQGVWWARSRTVTWPERNNHMEEAQLLMPRDARGPVPLVVQLDVPQVGRFRPDGGTPTAVAAQALVAQGMAVLHLDTQTGRDHPEDSTRPWLEGRETRPMAEVELPAVRDRIEAAVASLAAQRLIDPARVGLIGFSRTGLYAHYVISHPNRLIPAAAAINDSVTAGYGQYIGADANGTGRGPRHTTAREPEIMYGGMISSNPQGWMEHAPLFNTHRVETPALFTFNVGGTTPIFGPLIIEVVAAFRRAGREMDLRLITDQVHRLQRPQARLASMSFNIDWMDFWLQGREHPDPARAGQYLYWRSLREHRDARRAAPARPAAVPAPPAVARPDNTEP